MSVVRTAEPGERPDLLELWDGARPRAGIGAARPFRGGASLRPGADAGRSLAIGAGP